MNQTTMVEQTVPGKEKTHFHNLFSESSQGEFRWFSLQLYRVNYIVHIYLSIVGSILISVQFFPAVRRVSRLVQNVNQGYYTN